MITKAFDCLPRSRSRLQRKISCLSFRASDSSHAILVQRRDLAQLRSCSAKGSREMVHLYRCNPQGRTFWLPASHPQELHGSTWYCSIHRCLFSGGEAPVSIISMGPSILLVASLHPAKPKNIPIIRPHAEETSALSLFALPSAAPYTSPCFTPESLLLFASKVKGDVEAAVSLSRTLGGCRHLSLARCLDTQGCKDGHRPIDQQSTVIKSPVPACSHNLFH
jgi:hypothetical protein